MADRWLSVVDVLGASNHTDVEAAWLHRQPDRIGAHVRILALFGGTRDQLVSGNLKAGVTKACFYEPKVNRTYAGLATHYDTAILPARPYRPRGELSKAPSVRARWRTLHRRRPATPADGTAITHQNIRRPEYFQRGDD
ncbi:MAG: hypothetical protein AAF968_10960 [Pseudomonadota bacterium]